MDQDLDITALAARIEETCTTLESDIEELRRQKKAITAEIKAKTDELALAQSMRPRKRKTKPVTAPTPPTQ